MHTVIYITGPQGSGKSTLASGFRKSQERTLEGNENQDEVLSRAEKEINCEHYIFTMQEFCPAFNYTLWLYAQKNNKKYFNIRLTQNKNTY